MNHSANQGLPYPNGPARRPGSLGKLVKEVRKSKGIPLTSLAADFGVSKSLMSQLENDRVQTPNPRVLEILSGALDIDLSDLYAAAGYTPASSLPAFAPYLRSRYRDLPPAARKEVEEVFERVRERYGRSSQGPQPGEDEMFI